MMVIWARGGYIRDDIRFFVFEDVLNAKLRKFWRENLPRLKYWNPSVPMIVNRTEDQTSPATMTVYFYQNRDGTSTPNSTTPTSSTQGRAKAPPPSENERVLTIDMKHQHSDDILATFMQKTGAVPVVPTTQDESEMRELDSLKQRGTIDRARVLNDLTAARREARMLAQAQSQVVAMKAT